jgi:toxin ParE1/3/4
MTFTVLISATAEADLKAIFEYVAARADRAIAQRFVDRIEDYVAGFETMPERGRLRDDLRPGLRTVGFRRRATILFEVDRVRRQVLILGVYYAGRSFEATESDLEE